MQRKLRGSYNECDVILLAKVEVTLVGTREVLKASLMVACNIKGPRSKEKTHILWLYSHFSVIHVYHRSQKVKC